MPINYNYRYLFSMSIFGLSEESEKINFGHFGIHWFYANSASVWSRLRDIGNDNPFAMDWEIANVMKQKSMMFEKESDAPIFKFLHKNRVEFEASLNFTVESKNKLYFTRNFYVYGAKITHLRPILSSEETGRIQFDSHSEMTTTNIVI